MKSTIIWGLGALNVLLVVMLVMHLGISSKAFAQSAGRPGDYLMIAGEVNGGNDAVVYVVDQSSHQLSALVYDDTTQSLSKMAPLNLDRLFTDVSGTTNRRIGNP